MKANHNEIFQSDKERGLLLAEAKQKNESKSQLASYTAYGYSVVASRS